MIHFRIIKLVVSSNNIIDSVEKAKIDDKSECKVKEKMANRKDPHSSFHLIIF